MRNPDELPGNLSFEEGLTRLEALLTAMERDELTLEEMLTLYENGKSLVDICNQLLAEAELRIKILDESHTE